MKAAYAQSAIRDRELKVSRIKELNDPFEFMPALPFVHPSWPPERVDQSLEFLREDFHPIVGIISMSARVDDPVIWSHYADKHRGIALGFDLFLDDSLMMMTYPKDRPAIDMDRFEKMSAAERMNMVRNILCAKAPSWCHEMEYRAFVELKSCREKAGSYFHKLPDDCLKHVILGVRCETTEDEISTLLGASGFSEVVISKARRCPTRFAVLV